MNDPYRTAIEDRLATLWRYRQWYRRQPNWSVWMDLAWDNDRELRALIRIARTARRASRVDARGDHFARMPATR